jgi:FixJ family two-component response regulator
LWWYARCGGWRALTVFTRIFLLSRVPVVSIVDDDESIRTATMRYVRLHGFLVHAFASAEEFLQSPNLGETSCLITDVSMPGMSGIDLQSYLITQGQHIPIIFITAFPEETGRARALEAGAIGFLTKPFDGQTLIDTLNEALQGSNDDPSDQPNPTTH